MFFYLSVTFYKNFNKKHLVGVKFYKDCLIFNQNLSKNLKEILSID